MMTSWTWLSRSPWGVVRDRVGVLYAITRVLAAMGLDIHLAKVNTAGVEVADIFYVTAQQEKISDPELIGELRAGLEDALAQVAEE